MRLRETSDGRTRISSHIRRGLAPRTVKHELLDQRRLTRDVTPGFGTMDHENTVFSQDCVCANRFSVKRQILAEIERAR